MEAPGQQLAAAAPVAPPVPDSAAGAKTGAITPSDLPETTRKDIHSVIDSLKDIGLISEATLVAERNQEIWGQLKDRTISYEQFAKEVNFYFQQKK
jgi:hypothetical protein